MLRHTKELTICSLIHCVSHAHAAVLGSKEESGEIRGELVTVCHNGKNTAEAQRIYSRHANTTRILEVSTVTCS